VTLKTGVMMLKIQRCITGKKYMLKCIIIRYILNFKGLVHPKIKMYLLTFMLFQTRKTFVHLWDTN